MLVSPRRTLRPWQGQHEKPADPARPRFEASCYLCPGNRRANGEKNPDYQGAHVFDNDFPALLPAAVSQFPSSDPLFRQEAEHGACRVICYSPRHDLSVPHMMVEDVASVVRLWTREYLQFKATPDIAYAQIFENKGEAMGSSNPHPHCQIWASSGIPGIVTREQRHQATYLERHGAPLLLDYVARELDLADRIVYQNRAFVVVVPYWAVWPFETLILPREHRPSLDRLSDDETLALADAYQALTQTYDRLFNCEFPYTAGVHQAPATDQDHQAWQLHMHFYPPLLRSATTRKFMVGYEMLASPQRDITAEHAAALLRQA